MAAFFRIKNYVINLEALAYVRIENSFIVFGFTFHADTIEGQNYIRLRERDSFERWRIRAGKGICAAVA